MYIYVYIYVYICIYIYTRIYCYFTLKAESYRMSTVHGLWKVNFLEKVDFYYGMSTFYNQIAIES